MRHRGTDTGGGEPVAHSVTDTLQHSEPLWRDPASNGSSPEGHALVGRHTLPAQPHVPTQKQPVHESVEPAERVRSVVPRPTVETPPATESQASPETPSYRVPAHAQWKAGQGPRMFAASLLLLSVGGASALGLRYAQSHRPDDLLSLVVGIGVVVALWAMLIASTPQVVSLRGSVLTVRNSSGTERFDLGDALQPVDLVGEPRSSHWALLLHRPNNTSVVLRRRDVDAAALDPIVRHYRAMADQRYSDRQVRFSR